MKHDNKTEIKVEQIKNKAHTSAAQATRDINRLNKRLEQQNHISFQIHTAAGGGSGY